VAVDESADESDSGRSARTDALWADVRIDPVEIALPGGVGYTLRAYRAAAETTPSAEEDLEAEVELDDFDAAAAAVLRSRRPQVDDEALDEEDEAEDEEDEEDEDDEEEDEDEDEDDEEEDEENDKDEQVEAVEEDVPIFLGRRSRVYLFHSPDKLVEFVRSDVEHQLSGLDTWSDLVRRITTEDIVALEDDTYELDLVVENLRGGAVAWDPKLILKAGELARDLAYALRLEAVQTALAPGSPLDDLDDALRAAESGGVGAFFAKRKLKKLPAQQSSLAWRTVIGKISAAADWRD
jgi:hypothetical protein